MKQVILFSVSLMVISNLIAQSSPAHGTFEDDQDPNSRRNPKMSVDTPHFQTTPSEGISGGADADKYCASVVGGKIAVIYKGKMIMDNITLSNGTVIFKDGTVVPVKGPKRILKNGECIDKNGDNM